MAQHWRCTRCGTFHGRTSRFQDEPDECRECSHAEFETITSRRSGGFSLERSLNLDAFTWMAMGMAIFNVIFALLGGFANSDPLMYSAGGSFVALLLAAYLLSNRTWAAWVYSLVVFVGVFVLGVVVVIPEITGFFELGSPVPVIADDVIFVLYGVMYVFLGLIGIAMLFGGRDGIKGQTTHDDASRSSG